MASGATPAPGTSGYSIVSYPCIYYECDFQSQFQRFCGHLAFLCLYFCAGRTADSLRVCVCVRYELVNVYEVLH